MQLKKDRPCPSIYLAMRNRGHLNLKVKALRWKHAHILYAFKGNSKLANVDLPEVLVRNLLLIIKKSEICYSHRP